MDATQMNRFIYSYVRLYNGRQVCDCAAREAQCFHPEIKQINFYSENDRYFGHFLRDTCYNSRSICTKFAFFSFYFSNSFSPKCQKPLYQHQIIILHNGFQLTISSSIVGNARHQSDVIRTWRSAFVSSSISSRCKCGQETLPEVVSNEVLFLSVGVVLQLIFYDTDSKGPCGHSLFHDRVCGMRLL